MHTRKFSFPLLLAATTFAAHTGSAAAADTSMQQQVIEFVAGSVTTRTTSASERLAGGKGSSQKVDAQDFARELLSGTLSAHIGKVNPAIRPLISRASGESSGRINRLDHSDIQAMVREMLLGRHPS